MSNTSFLRMVILYLFALNVVTFVLYGIDKYKARRSRWRIPEAVLLGLAVVGGSVGAWLGMIVWHHKTLHKKFRYGIPLILALQIALLIVFCFMRPGRKCNPDIMAAHYEEHHTEMEELHRYVQTAIADSFGVTLEFDGNQLERFYVKGPDKLYLTYSDEKAREREDSVMAIVGLTQEEYDNICKQLKEMGCIGIDYSQSTPEQLTIWFRRVGTGLYWYTILNRPMTDEEKASAVNWVAIPYNDHCYFVYHSPFGQESFPEKVREDFLKKHKPW